MTYPTGWTMAYRWLLLVPLCFLLGWSAAEIDGDLIRSAKALLAETYLNKFNTMSGANVDEYVYYVVSDNLSSLQDFTAETRGAARVEVADYAGVFNVYIKAESRRELFSRMRRLPSVSAVFTVPFMCH